MKTKQQKLEQVKRIMNALQKRGQNNEKINSIYKDLLKNNQYICISIVRAGSIVK